MTDAKSGTTHADGHAAALPPIGSFAEFGAAVRWAVRSAVDRDARRICFADVDFSLWPLDDETLIADLAGWLRLPLRKLVLLMRDDGAMPRSHPRFVAWRRDWTHAVEAWRLADDVQLELPSVVVDDGPVSLHLIDAVHWRGRASLDVRDAHRWRETIDALLQRSESALPAHHLGL